MGKLMMNTILKIKKFNILNNIDICLVKINIIGGYNSTGKTTASKILYCFLKANCNKRRKFVYETITNDIIKIINTISDYLKPI